MRRIAAAVALAATSVALPVATETVAAAPWNCRVSAYVSSHQTGATCYDGFGTYAAVQTCAYGEVSFNQWGNTVSVDRTSVTGWCSGWVVSRRVYAS